jgi:prepilin signal peptidase PulO-like enzyme (type II secretory pathway)
MEFELIPWPWELRAVVGFVLGAIMGSFLSALSYRWPRGLSIIKPRSACPHCRTVLGIKDLVPILSYIWHHGRCAYCGTAYGYRYLLLECASAVLWAIAWAWVGFGVWLVVALSAIFVGLYMLAVRMENG